MKPNKGVLLLCLCLVLFGVIGCSKNQVQTTTSTNDFQNCGVTQDLNKLPTVGMAKDYESEKTLVCFGNNLFNCKRSNVEININGTIAGLTVIGTDNRKCVVRADFRNLIINGTQRPNSYLQCPYNLTLLKDYGCIVASCGKPGVATVLLLFNNLIGIKDINKAKALGCTTNLVDNRLP